MVVLLLPEGGVRRCLSGVMLVTVALELTVSSNVAKYQIPGMLYEICIGCFRLKSTAACGRHDTAQCNAIEAINPLPLVVLIEVIAIIELACGVPATRIYLSVPVFSSQTRTGYTVFKCWCSRVNEICGFTVCCRCFCLCHRPCCLLIYIFLRDYRHSISILILTQNTYRLFQTRVLICNTWTRNGTPGPSRVRGHDGLQGHAFRRRHSALPQRLQTSRGSSEN